MSDAEAALRELAASLVGELAAAQTAELTERARQDAAMELSWPVWDDDAVRSPARAASGPVRSPAPAAGSLPAAIAGPPATVPGPPARGDWQDGYAAPPPPGPPACTDPHCDHMTLRCPTSRTHLVGGHPANRSHLISVGSVNAPAGSASARGQGSQALTAGRGGDEIELAATEVRPYERTTEGRPEHVRHYTRQAGTELEHPGDLRGLGPRPVSNLGTRWVQGEPGHFVRGISTPQWQAGQELWTGRGRAVTPEHAATSFAARGGSLAPALLGGGHQSWNGTVRLFDAADEPQHSAELAWDGTMGLQRELAAKMAADHAGTGPIADPQPYVTVLHELFHGTVPPGQTHAMHRRAYGDPANASIEEGFDELGTVQHAPEFFRAMGIGDRLTPILAASGDRKATMAEYAERLADPWRIAAGTSWGHYGWQTAAALKWTQDAAEATGRPAQELADEINREGVGGKVPAMARQAIRAAGADPDDLAGAPFAGVENVIRANWPAQPGQENQAWAAAVAEARYRTPAPPDTGKTSGAMKAGDMVHSLGGDYQAIAQAPVSWSAGQAHREIGGHTVKGSWSDPWWMTRQGGGWAVSRRWRSKAQTSYGGWDAASNRHISVEIPAKDERVLTAWYPGAGTGQDIADTQALYASPDGGYTPERAALHEAIIADVLAGAEPADQPVATFMGGGPASGKSAMLAVRPAQGVVIDPDAIKGRLPEYVAGVARRDPTAAAHVHEESSDVAREIQARAIARSLSFTLDGTGDSNYAKMARKVAAARAAGYQVAARYVTVDTDAALQRIIARAERTGRLVPAAYAREIHASVSDVFRQAIADDLFDSAELFDNNGARGEPITLVGSKKPGGSWQVSDEAAWRAFLAKAQTAALDTEAAAAAAESGKAAGG